MQQNFPDNALYEMDNLEVLRGMNSQTVDLIANRSTLQHQTQPQRHSRTLCRQLEMGRHRHTARPVEMERSPSQMA